MSTTAESKSNMANHIDMILRTRMIAAQQQKTWALQSSITHETQIEQQHICQGCEHFRGDGIPPGLVLFCFCLVILGAACWGYFLGMMAGL